MPSILQLTKVIIFYWVIGVMTYVVISIQVGHVLHCFANIMVVQGTCY